MEPKQRSSASSKLYENLSILRTLNVGLKIEDSDSLLDYNISSPAPSQMMQNIDDNHSHNKHMNHPIISSNDENIDKNYLTLNNQQRQMSQSINHEQHQNVNATTIRSKLQKIRQLLGGIKTENNEIESSAGNLLKENLTQLPSQPKNRSYQVPFDKENIQNLNPQVNQVQVNKIYPRSSPQNPTGNLIQQNSLNLQNSALATRPAINSSYPNQNLLGINQSYYPSQMNSIENQHRQCNSMANSMPVNSSSNVPIQIHSTNGHGYQYNFNLGRVSNDILLGYGGYSRPQEYCVYSRIYPRNPHQNSISSIHNHATRAILDPQYMSNESSYISNHRRLFPSETVTIDLTGNNSENVDGRRLNFEGGSPGFRGLSSNMNAGYYCSGLNQSNFGFTPDNPNYLSQHDSSNFKPNFTGYSASEGDNLSIIENNQQNRGPSEKNNEQPTQKSNQTTSESNPTFIQVSSILKNLVTISPYFEVKFHQERLINTAVRYDKASIKYFKDYFEQVKKMFEKCKICNQDRKKFRTHCHHKDIDFDVLLTYDIPYCDYDGKIFRSKADFNCHMKTHVTVNCEECGEELKESTLEFHMNVKHKNIGEYKCNQCEKVFNNQMSFKKHTKVHDKKFECKICNRKFPIKATLQEHFNAYHNDNKKDQVRCPICDKKITRKSSLKKHMLIHDKTTPKRFKCNRCDFETHLPATFKIHTNSHILKDKKYAELKNPVKCSKCPAHLKNEVALKNHIMNVHPKVVFICDLCGRVIRVKSNMTKHIKIHLKNLEMERK